MYARLSLSPIGGDASNKTPDNLLQRLSHLISNFEACSSWKEPVTAITDSSAGGERAPTSAPPPGTRQALVDEVSATILDIRSSFQAAEAGGMTDQQALEVWKLSTRLWNACCGLAPFSDTVPDGLVASADSCDASATHDNEVSYPPIRGGDHWLQARVRHLACDLLSLAPCTKVDLLRLHSGAKHAAAMGRSSHALGLATQAALQRVVWHSRAGQGWLKLGALEDAELCMSRGGWGTASMSPVHCQQHFFSLRVRLRDASLLEI